MGPLDPTNILKSTQRRLENQPYDSLRKLFFLVSGELSGAAYYCTQTYVPKELPLFSEQKYQVYFEVYLQVIRKYWKKSNSNSNSIYGQLLSGNEKADELARNASLENIARYLGAYHPYSSIWSLNPNTY